MENSVFPNRFYVYALYRPEYEYPFYIGKGHDDRIDHHEQCSRRRETCKHRTCRVIRKVWREGGEIEKAKVAEGLTEEDAFAFEQLLVKQGRADGWPLVNQTDGGEGISGYKYTPEQRVERKRIAQRLLAEGKFDHMKTLYIGRVILPEAIERRSKSIRQTWSDPVLRELRRQQSRQMWQSSAHKEKQRQGLQEYYATHPEAGQQRSERAKRNWSDPEFRARQKAGMHDPMVTAKLRKGRLGKLPSNTKTYPGFLAPDGVTVHENIFNLAAFCREHGLSKPKMCLVAQGKRKSHQGWTLYPPLPEKPPTYYHTGFVSPSGEIFTSIVSLTAFCKEHGLQHSNMTLVAQGKQDDHKGWTRYNS